MSRRREPYGHTAKLEEYKKRREELGLKKGEHEMNLFKGKGNVRGVYVSPMDEAEDEYINSLLSTTEKLELVGFCDMIREMAGLWKGPNENRFTRTQKSKFVNMIKTLKKDLFENGKWNKRDYEYACWCLWLLDELKNEKGDSIIYDNDEFADIQLALLEKATEGIVDDYINSERRYNWVMLGKNIVIE